MLSRRLPALEIALHRLARQGRLYPEAFHEFEELDIVVTHPQEGVRKVRIDPLIFRAVTVSFTGNKALRDALNARDMPVASILQMLQLLQAQRSKGYLWGATGYAKTGYSYHEELTGIQKLYKFLNARPGRISLAIDGASAFGALGINCAVAQTLRIPTLGVSPLLGLHHAAMHNFLICRGVTYEDREKLVGLLPDVVVCWGGKDGTFREARSALRAGGIVLLMKLSKYRQSFMNSASHMLELERIARLQGGRIIVCKSLDHIEQTAAQVLNLLAQENNWDRRQQEFMQELRR